ncbi:MAG: hypothetical protein K1X67_23620 [Fimbriimonadaceae bacterium]|nr:hypothetical protein [Fimbriimonadaceae bacterium]
MSWKHLALASTIALLCGFSASCDPARRLQIKNGFNEPIPVDFNGSGEWTKLEPGWKTSIHTLGPAPDAQVTATFPNSPGKPARTWTFDLDMRGVNKRTLVP